MLDSWLSGRKHLIANEANLIKVPKVQILYYPFIWFAQVVEWLYEGLQIPVDVSSILTLC